MLGHHVGGEVHQAHVAQLGDDMALEDGPVGDDDPSRPARMCLETGEPVRRHEGAACDVGTSDLSAARGSVSVSKTPSARVVPSWCNLTRKRPRYRVMPLRGLDSCAGKLVTSDRSSCDSP